MKRIITTLFFILLVAAAVQYLPKIEKWFARSPQVAQIVKDNPTVVALKQQVLTGGALRSVQNDIGGHLDLAGVIELTNRARNDNGGLAPLRENSLLDQDAQAKLKDMFARQYFEHVSPDGKGPSDQAKAAGYQYAVIGENLALGNFKDDQALITAWMNSPGHRANILNTQYQDIGVAVGQGTFEGKKAWLAVQEFGRPVASCPVVNSNLKSQIDAINGDVSAIQVQLKSLKSQLDNQPDPGSQQQADAYNVLVNQYNDMAKIYNNKLDQLKQDTSEYNAEVQAFNACAS